MVLISFVLSVAKQNQNLSNSLLEHERFKKWRKENIHTIFINAIVI